MIIHQHTDNKWYVWEGSCSVDYFEPSEQCKSFDTENDAKQYAQAEADKSCILEGGVQYLTQSEIINGLRQEVDYLRNPAYCPKCNACGEDPCCSGAMCKQNKCLYGERYADHYTYHKLLVTELWKALDKYNKEELHELHDKCYNTIWPEK